MKQIKTRATQKQSSQNGSAAACDTGDKLAVAVNPELKAAAVRRLRRIAGQVRGLESMVDQERYCADILVQIASVQEAMSDSEQVLEPDGEELEPAEALAELLEEILDGLDLDADVEVDEEDGVLTGRLEGEGLGLFIGRRGQTIDAVQHLAQRIVFPEGPSSVRVVIDADGYRERRAVALRAQADDAADEALSAGRPVELEPLPPFERRIVHEYMRERGDVDTHSEGEEPERYLIITPRGA